MDDVKTTTVHLKVDTTTGATVEGFPLSPQQRRVWRLTHDKAASPYWSRCVVRVRGPIVDAVMRPILENLPARFEILRTSFFASEEMSTPLQVIEPAGKASPVEYLDLRASDARAQETAILAVQDRMDAALGADKSSPPLVSMLSLSPDEHLLLLGLPALRSDGRGLENLVADIAKQYEAAKGAVTPLDEVLQYADVSISLNEILESSDAAAGRRFWESHDFSEALTLRLPFERGGSADRPFSPRRLSVGPPPDSVSAADRLSSDRGIPPEIFALTCLQVLVQRTTGVDKVAVGYVSDGRGYAELEEAVGLFARCLPLSGELPDDIPFADALRRIADAVGDAKTWGECFDGRLVPRERGDEAAFVRIAFEPIVRNARHAAGDLSLEIEEVDACVDRFALKLCVEATNGALGGMWVQYDAGAFRGRDVARWAEQFETLFASAVAEPECAVGRLRLLPVTQEEEILAVAGREAPAVQPADLVHRRFEAQAARVPSATAVVCEASSLTYGQLNDRANQLARHLQRLGVGPDVVAGICLDRSVDFVVAILGILKAGGAYVPLDPHLPPARLAGMIEDSAARIVISRAGLAGLLPSSVQTVLLDRDGDVLAAAPSENVSSDSAPENLVYVLFTSGSTGKPKGVAIEHRQLASYVGAVSARLELPPAAGFATVTTFAADLGHTAVYPALTSGGCLHIVAEERASDPSALADYFDRHSIDVLKIVPSHLKALLTCARPERVLPRQRLVLGGEPCTWDLVDQVHRLAPACRIFNHYGPTEATVGSTVYAVPHNGTRPPAATVPIGRPLDHARAYVVDRHLQLVPLGVAGELCIGGAGVARGYLAAPELTQEKFVPDRSAEPGGRMYRTGDRVRMLPDGMLEFLGRADSQIKIRGFRVEIGEIEAALRRHPQVKDVTVLAHDDGSGTRVSACLVCRDHLPPAEGLKAFLQEQLPDYMIPSAFVGMDVLPLTPNGKLDRQRLIGLVEAAARESVADEALTEWESRVALIWQELLGVDDVRARDNFYDLGGHSLLAIQVVTALEKRAGVQVSPRDLVFHTLKQFAALCESKSPDAATSV